VYWDSETGIRVWVLKIKLDPDKTPKEVNLHDAERGDRVPLLGIYEVEKGRLRLCWSRNDGRDRPPSFGAERGQRRIFLSLERVKE
jgi:uncharacterized protein (TIGR03067 family)